MYCSGGSSESDLPDSMFGINFGAPKPIPEWHAGSFAKLESAPESQFAPVTESELSTELELAPE